MAIIKNVSPVKKYLFLILALCIGHTVGVLLFYFYAWGGSGFFQHMSFSPSRFRFMWSFFNVHPTARMLFHGLLAKGRPGLIELTRRIGCFGFFYVFFKFFPIFVWALLFVEKKEDEDKDEDTIQGRWATEKELRKSGNLFDWNPKKLPDIIMAQANDAKLKWINSGTTGYYSTIRRGSGLIGANQGTNVFTFGGTGDGKGIGTILPTLLANQNSVIVYDPKGENFEKSAGWRQSFSRVLFFDPTDPKCTCHFNPLDWISKDSINILRDIKDMTAIICPMDKANSDPFWVRKGRQIIEFLICYVLLYREKERQNLYEVANVIYNFSSDLNKVKDENQKMIELLQKKQSEEQDEAIQQKLQAEIDKLALRQREYDKTYKNSQQATLAILDTFETMKKIVERDYEAKKNTLVGDLAYQSILYRHLATALASLISEAKAETTMSSVFSTANEALDFFRDETIAPLMNETTFDLTSLQNSDKPMSIYLCIPAGSIESCKPFVRLFISCILNQSQKDQKTKRRFPLLWILDEFPQLGNIPEIEKAIKIVRSLCMSFIFVTQSLSDLTNPKVWGPDDAKSIINNCHILDVKSASDNETTKMLQEMLGNKTNKIKKYTKSKGKDGQTSVSESTETKERPLIYSSEIRELSDEQLIIRKKGKSYKAKRLAYFEFDMFSERTGLPYDIEIERKNIEAFFMGGTGKVNPNTSDEEIAKIQAQNNAQAKQQNEEKKPVKEEPQPAEKPEHTENVSQPEKQPEQEKKEPEKKEPEPEQEKPTVKDEEKNEKIKNVEDYLVKSGFNLDTQTKQRLLAINYIHSIELEQQKKAERLAASKKEEQENSLRNIIGNYAGAI